MAPTSLLILLLLTSFLPLQLCNADSGLHSNSLPSDQQLNRDAVFTEMESVKIQLSSLEKKLLEKDTDLFDKENIISSLKDKLHAIQKGGSEAVESMLDRTKQKSKQLVKTVAELEEELSKNKMELSISKRRAESLNAAEKRRTLQCKELERKLRDHKQKTDGLKKSLQHAQEAVRQMAAQYNAKNQELRETHTQWLPPWAFKYVTHLRASLSNQWSTLGRPLFDPVIGKEKEHSKVVSYVTTLNKKAIKHLEATRALLSTYLKTADNYIQKSIQVVKKSSSPYMDKASAVLRPYIKRIQLLCKPYTQKVIKNCYKYVKYATNYHLQLQSNIKKTLKKSKYLASIASKELVWLLASAFLIMPLYGVLILLSAIFSDRRQPMYLKAAGPHKNRKVRHSRRFNK